MADGGGVERIEPPGGRWSCDSRALTGRSLTWTAAPRVFSPVVFALNNESTLTWVADEIFSIPTAGCKYFMFPPRGEKTPPDKWGEETGDE